MPTLYYLSTFIGTGSESEPFRPATRAFGPGSMLDLRPDETKQAGWCVSTVGSKTIEASNEGKWFFLTDDPKADMDKEVIARLKENLGVDFRSLTLADVLAEILLMQKIPNRGLRPGIDGAYRINLSGTIWSATEAEAFEFVGRIREPDLLGIAPVRNRPRADLSESLTQAMEQLRDITDSDRPNWLQGVVEKYRAGRSRHPLAQAASAVNELLSSPWKIHGSASAIRLMLLARDLSVTLPHLDEKRLGARLRSVDDFEPTTYELFVHAGYVELGYTVEVTDEKHGGEFKVFVGKQTVHIECKHKTLRETNRRHVKEVFDAARSSIQTLMTEKGRYALVLFYCRTDPVMDDLDLMVAMVSRALDDRIDEKGQAIESGKFHIELVPSNWITAGSPGVRFPVGFDGFSEATVPPNAEGPAGSGWGIGWRVERPGGWIRSVIESVRQAAKQLPPDAPNAVYVHIPGGSLGAMKTRIDSVHPAIEQLLDSADHHTRINAVVLTGHATVVGWSGPGIATLKYVYDVIPNRNARQPFPEGFSLLGAEATRRPRIDRAPRLSRD